MRKTRLLLCCFIPAFLSTQTLTHARTHAHTQTHTHTHTCTHTHTHNWQLAASQTQQRLRSSHRWLLGKGQHPCQHITIIPVLLHQFFPFSHTPTHRSGSNLQQAMMQQRLSSLQAERARLEEALRNHVPQQQQHQQQQQQQQQQQRRQAGNTGANRAEGVGGGEAGVRHDGIDHVSILLSHVLG